jgi:hypothetical protein
MRIHVETDLLEQPYERADPALPLTIRCPGCLPLNQSNSCLIGATPKLLSPQAQHCSRILGGREKREKEQCITGTHAWVRFSYILLSSLTYNSR